MINKETINGDLSLDFKEEQLKQIVKSYSNNPNLFYKKIQIESNKYMIVGGLDDHLVSSFWNYEGYMQAYRGSKQDTYQLVLNHLRLDDKIINEYNKQGNYKKLLEIFLQINYFFHRDAINLLIGNRTKLDPVNIAHKTLLNSNAVTLLDVAVMKQEGMLEGFFQFNEEDKFMQKKKIEFEKHIQEGFFEVLFDIKDREKLIEYESNNGDYIKQQEIMTNHGSIEIIGLDLQIQHLDYIQEFIDISDYKDRYIYIIQSQANKKKTKNDLSNLKNLIK